MAESGELLRRSDAYDEIESICNSSVREQLLALQRLALQGLALRSGESA